MFKEGFKNKKGSAMVFTTILIANALVIVASMVFISAVLQKNTGAMSLTPAAFQEADSGMEYYLYRINKSPVSTISGLCPNGFNNRKCSTTWTAGGVDFSVTAYFLNSNDSIIGSGSSSPVDISRIRVTGEASKGNIKTSRTIEADLFRHP